MPTESRGVAVVTGATSGIGEATARHLATLGFDLVVGGRRVDRLRAVADPIGARWAALDVTDASSVDRFCADLDACRVLVNNAGGALGLDPIERANEDEWRSMYEVNVMGTLRMTKRLLPLLDASGDGHVVTIGSIAAYEPYVGGAGYNAAKFAERAFSRVLRMELLGRPIRISEIDPGMVMTEFSKNRFRGDEARAKAVYRGMTPLSAEDIAECIGFVVTRPSHVNIDTLVVLARDQAGATTVHRHEADD
ncbi:MAG TPA: SDR family NAD(P)-dependent oxidoreductase [Acidimicrobiales bacterium]|nr:SDR family NAD(P)-dependent oxidoreductase [Acidimicrobiales bacterium]